MGSGESLHAVETVILLLLVLVAAFAAVARRLKVPYPIVLVLAGLVISFFPRMPRVPLDPNIVFVIFLPPLLYSSAWAMSWREFRRNAVVIGLLAVSMGQAHALGRVIERHGRISLYVSTMAFEWVMVAFIWMGVRRRGVKMRELVGGKWKAPEDALLDVAIAFVYWICALGILALVRLALGLISLNQAENAKKMNELSKTLGFLAPHSNLEFALFVALALTAGFCEEIIFRGYLQKQFAAASGITSIGIIAQGVLFGAAHGYQGAKLMFTIGVYGALFGILAAWRKSLRPGMMAHFLQDFISGLLLRFLTQAPR